MKYFSEFIQKLIRSSTRQYQSIHQVSRLASVALEIFCWRDFIYIFSKGHNSGKGHNPDGKKNMGQLFYHEESIYEISKP